MTPIKSFGLIEIVETMKDDSRPISEINSDHILWTRRYPDGRVEQFLAYVDAYTMEKLDNDPN